MILITRDEEDFLNLSDLEGTDEEKVTYYRMQKAKGIPHAYIVGAVDFFGSKIKVSKGCLIPRVETELLAEKVTKMIPENAVVLDLCCGSGALGLSIKAQRDDVCMTLSDASMDALFMTVENAKRLGLDIGFSYGDFLTPHKGRKFNVIICNPPYVTEEEYASLEESVKAYEPKMALVGKDNGLEFYKRLAKEVDEYLEDGGLICLEIGKDQGKAVLDLFDDQHWKKTLEQDYSGHDRFIFLEKSAGSQ